MFKFGAYIMIIGILSTNNCIAANESTNFLRSRKQAEDNTLSLTSTVVELFQIVQEVSKNANKICSGLFTGIEAAEPPQPPELTGVPTLLPSSTPSKIPPSQTPSISSKPSLTLLPSSIPSFSPTQFTPTWPQQGQDLTGISKNFKFGSSVAISSDGKKLIVGGFQSLRIYSMGTSSWFIPIETNVFDYLVSAIAFSSNNNYIAVGSFDTSSIGTNGKVAVFEHEVQSGIWTQLGGTISEGRNGDKFGYSVDISDDGKQIISGAPGGSAPYVRVATLFDNRAWFSGRIDNTKVGFGTSVSMSSDGKTAFIGATEGDGSVSIYDLSNLNSPNVQILTGNGEGFGAVSALSSDGTTFAVGTANGDYVKVFSKNVSGSWTQLGNDIVGRPGTSFGQSLSISGDGNRIAIGAKTLNTNGSLGNVFVHSLSLNRFVGVFYGEAEGDFGFSVAISDDGSSVAIGGPLIDDDTTLDSGLVRVFHE